MRAKPTFVVALAMSLLTAGNTAAGWKTEFLVSAASKQELEAWANSKQGFVELHSVKAPAGEILAILIDYGSGLAIYSAYIYARSGDSFDLLVYRQLPPTGVMADKPLMRLDESGNLLLESNSGRTYLMIPADELYVRWK